MRRRSTPLNETQLPGTTERNKKQRVATTASTESKRRSLPATEPEKLPVQIWKQVVGPLLTTQESHRLGAVSKSTRAQLQSLHESQEDVCSAEHCRLRRQQWENDLLQEKKEAKESQAKWQHCRKVCEVRCANLLGTFIEQNFRAGDFVHLIVPVDGFVVYLLVSQEEAPEGRHEHKRAPRYHLSLQLLQQESVFVSGVDLRERDLHDTGVARSVTIPAKASRQWNRMAQVFIDVLKAHDVRYTRKAHPTAYAVDAVTSETTNLAAVVAEICEMLFMFARAREATGTKLSTIEVPDSLAARLLDIFGSLFGANVGFSLNKVKTVELTFSFE